MGLINTFLYSLLMRRIKVNSLNALFNEYFEFLESKGVDVDQYNLKEGYYWMDRMIIRAYTRDGKRHKICRVHIDDSLEIEVTSYDNMPNFDEIESWKETIERSKDKLIELENESLELIKNKLEEYKEKTPIVLTSGGKDSNLTAHLVRRVQSDTHAIFNNTSLDCADTYKAIKKDKNLTILSPDEGFYQWRERNNFIPTRFARACCGIFKEGETVRQLDSSDKYLFFMGMRNAESNHRSGYVNEWKNEKWGDRDWLAILPIRKWTEEEVWLYTLWRGVEINAKYKKGYARVGCSIACPYYTKSSWVLDKYWYETGYNRWQDIIKNDFIDNDKWTVMNCTLEEYATCWNGGALRDEPTQEVIEEFMEYNDLDEEVAKRYFNHTCSECDRRIRKREDIAMNLKYFGRNTKKLLCKIHMKKYIGEMTDKHVTNADWDEIVEEFKVSECELF